MAKNRVDSQMVMQGDIGSVYGGTIIEKATTIEEALVLAGIDWKVGTKGKCLADKDRTPCPGEFGTFRTDPTTGKNVHLGTVRGRYKVIQNGEAFRPWQQFLGDAACVVGAGSLHGGRYVWLCLDLGEIEVLSGDVIRKHLLIINSHDGSSQIVAQILPNRWACQNMINVFTGVKGSMAIKVRHTGSALDKLEEARVAFSLVNEGYDEVQETFKIMAKTQITEEQTWELIYRGLGKSAKEVKNYFKKGTDGRTPQWVNQASEIYKVAMQGAGSDIPGVRGTVWGVLQGFTGWHDHYRIVRGSALKPDNAIESKIKGHDAKKKVQAYKACLDYCKN